MDPDDGRAAYVQFRLNGAMTTAAVESQIDHVEGQIARLQAAVAEQTAASVLREQGLLFAWARVRGDSRHELAALTEQPWFESLTHVAASSDRQLTENTATFDLPDWLPPPSGKSDGKGLRLIARLRDGGQLCLWLRPAEWPMVLVEAPPGSAAGTSALFGAVLAGLAAEGYLVDVVAACAQHCGLILADQPSGESPRIDGLTERLYFLQRAAWLMTDDSGHEPDVIDPEAAIRHLGRLQQRLFVLDEQRRQLGAQRGDLARVRRLEQEYEALLGLPHLTSLDIQGDRVEMSTDTIQVEGIRVGSFCVRYDFSAKSVRITNLTTPITDEGVRYDHPHVRSGRPCLGNIARPVADFLANRELPKLIPLTIDFLLSYNSSSPHHRLANWA